MRLYLVRLLIVDCEREYEDEVEWEGDCLPSEMVDCELQALGRMCCPRWPDQVEILGWKQIKGRRSFF